MTCCSGTVQPSCVRYTILSVHFIPVYINLFILPILCIYTVKWSYSVLLVRHLSLCSIRGRFIQMFAKLLYMIRLYTSKKFVVPFFIRAMLHLVG